MDELGAKLRAILVKVIDYVEKVGAGRAGSPAPSIIMNIDGESAKGVGAEIKSPDKSF